MNQVGMIIRPGDLHWGLESPYRVVNSRRWRQREERQPLSYDPGESVRRTAVPALCCDGRPFFCTS